MTFSSSEPLIYVAATMFFQLLIFHYKLLDHKGILNDYNA